MQPAQRIVTCLPLVELWDANGPLDACRAGYVGEAGIKKLLLDGSSFVVAAPGEPLRWVAMRDRFAFWKKEVSCRLVLDVSSFRLECYPGNYCYVAVAWERPPSPPVIVLEKHH